MTCDPSCSPEQDGQTALYVASKSGYDQIVDLLLRREAHVNHQIKVRWLPVLLVDVFLHEEQLL